MVRRGHNCWDSHSLWFLYAKFGHPLEEIGLLKGWGLRAVMVEVMGPESGNTHQRVRITETIPSKQTFKFSRMAPRFVQPGKAGSREPMGPSSH